jgi:hypothetical protein
MWGLIVSAATIAVSLVTKKESEVVDVARKERQPHVQLTTSDRMFLSGVGEYM